MKNEILLEAIGGIDEDLLVRSETFGASHRPLRRIAMIAAAVMLLAVTVFASAAGIQYWLGRSEDGLYNTLNFRYELSPVSIRPEALEELTSALNDRWAEDWEIVSEMDTYYYHALPYSETSTALRGISDLEDFLGIDLLVTPELEASTLAYLEEAAPGSGSEHIHLHLYGPRREDAMEEYSDTGAITLQAIGVQIYLSGQGTNCYGGLRLLIPLTEEFAESCPQETWYSELSDYQVEQTQFGNVPVYLCTADNASDRSTALALYGDGSNGYYAYVATEPAKWSKEYPGGWVDDPMELLLPLIQNLASSN